MSLEFVIETLINELWSISDLLLVRFSTWFQCRCYLNNFSFSRTNIDFDFLLVRASQPATWEEEIDDDRVVYVLCTWMNDWQSFFYSFVWIISSNGRVYDDVVFVITKSLHFFLVIERRKNALKIFPRWKSSPLTYFLDDMNYETSFRLLPCSTNFPSILIVTFLLSSSFVHGDTVQAKRTVEVNNEEKRVFDIQFGNKKNYAIDDCIPLAFGDFNADKIVDIFCRNTKGRSDWQEKSCQQWWFDLGDTIRVMINDDRSPTSKEICKVNIPGIIHDALAADFDGDSKLDLFVLYKSSDDQIGYNGGILWGDRTKLSTKEPFSGKECTEMFVDDLQPIGYLFQNIPTTLE